LKLATIPALPSKYSQAGMNEIEILAITTLLNLALAELKKISILILVNIVLLQKNFYLSVKLPILSEQ